MTHSRVWPLTAALLVLALTGFAGCAKDAVPPTPPPPEVSVVTLKTEPVTLTRELSGRTSPHLIAEVRPQATGIITRRLFTEGAFVKAGDPLYQLDDATYRAAYDSARAALLKAEATLASAELAAKRSAELHKIDAVSAQENENAIAAFEQAKADVASARANVNSTRVSLGYTRIVAPISGQTGKSSVTQGALVTANQATALVTIRQLDPIYVDLVQSSSELLQLRRELQTGKLQSMDDVQVRLVLEDGTEYPHPGKLQFSETTVNPATGSFALRVLVPNPDNLLLPGMYVRASLDVAVRPEALLVPQQAVTRDPRGNAIVLVVGENQEVVQRIVSTTRTIGDKWLVESGLSAGEQVIVEGLQKVQPGMQVKIVEFADDAPSVASR